MIYKFFCAISFIFLFLVTSAQTPCIEGMAGIYPCDNVDLIAHLNPAELGGGGMNDIWGWTDPFDGKEYVLLGKTTGTAFIDISDPTNPIYLGVLPTHTANSLWRDVKTYDNYAFIVSEAGEHGMQVFDLNRLRTVSSPPVTFTEDAHYNLFGNAHNIVINESVARAYAVGTSTFSGGLHIVNIADPLNPVIAGDYSLDGYTHDAQVVTYAGPDLDWQGSEVAFCANEDAVTIVNVDDPSDTETISISGYQDSGYTHQCWLTEDHEYLLVNDELDEIQLGINTTTFIWDVQDLDNPLFLGAFVNNTSNIDHNLYIQGNLSFQSNYRGGLRILDVQDVVNANLSEVAYFDVYPDNNNPNFNGSWSNYPYFESQLIAVSHMEDGLFIVEPNFVSLNLSDATICSDEELSVNISLAEGFLGAISLSVDGLPSGATASFSQNDISSPSIIELTLADWPNEDASYELKVIAEGEYFTYRRNLDVTVGQIREWYADSDGDGFGDDSQILIDCIQPENYVIDNSDCDDTRGDVYPDATGNQQGVDNDCNGVIESDESLPCSGDFNFDGVINIGDLLLLLADIGCTGDCIADINDNNAVNTSDLTSFLSVYGSNCD